MVAVGTGDKAVALSYWQGWEADEAVNIGNRGIDAALIIPGIDQDIGVIVHLSNNNLATGFAFFVGQLDDT